MIFVEPTFRRGFGPDACRMRGALGSARWNTDRIELVGALKEVALHRGDYGEVVHLRDREALKCAIATGALAGTDPDLARDIVRSTSPL